MNRNAAQTSSSSPRVRIIGASWDDWAGERELLEDHGFACDWQGADTLSAGDPGTALAEVVIVDADACAPAEALACVRPVGAETPPVLLVGGSADPEAIETAFAQGFDDVLTRPMSQALLLARVRSALGVRRMPPPGPRRVGPYTLDLVRRVIALHDSPVVLTAREFALARLLFDNLGQPLSREFALETVWGYRTGVATRTLDTHVSRVRTKLAMHEGNGVKLSALYGYGYQLDLC